MAGLVDAASCDTGDVDVACALGPDDGGLLRAVWLSADGGGSERLPSQDLLVESCSFDGVSAPGKDLDCGAAVFSVSGSGECAALLSALGAARRRWPHAFFVVHGAAVAGSIERRWQSFESGANMVSAELREVEQALGIVRRHCVAAGAARSGGAPCFGCPYCGLSLPGEELWEHLPLFHVHERNRGGRCPLCGEAARNLQVHVREAHVPAGRPPPEPEGDEAALVLVRGRGGAGEPWRYLAVHEFGGLGFWCPAGRAQPGEDLRAAAVRETWEEAGVEVELKGVLGVEETGAWLPGVRRRAFFLAEARSPPGGLAPTKGLPDFESAGAVWAAPEELRRVRLRAPEPLWCVEHLEGGGRVHPLECLG